MDARHVMRGMELEEHVTLARCVHGAMPSEHWVSIAWLRRAVAGIPLAGSDDHVLLVLKDLVAVGLVVEGGEWSRYRVSKLKAWDEEKVVAKVRARVCGGDQA